MNADKQADILAELRDIRNEKDAWPGRRDEAILRARAAGLSDVLIGAQLGLSRGQVNAIRRSLRAPEETTK